MKEETVIVWFRRDLRLADNPALDAALDGPGRVLPVYIHAPEEETPWQPGSASNWWLHQSLQSLDAGLRRLGARLNVYQGASEAILVRLIGEQQATQVFWNRLYDPATVSRDTGLKRRLEERGVECRSFNAMLLNEPWRVLNGQQRPYRVFGAYWRACAVELHQAEPPLPPPKRIVDPVTDTNARSPAELKLLPRIRWYRGFEPVWTPGEAGARARLVQALETAVPGYGARRDIPAIEGTSRLSPHLHFGEISVRQILWALLNRFGQSAAMEGDLRRYVTELGWREFAHYLLYHFPATASRSLDSRFEHAGWLEGDAAQALLHTWQRGETGIPIVDAGMRELWHTGWMHNRVRMIVASLLTKNLGVHWQEGARWFWDTLVDADLAANTLGWQWTAGCGADAAPYFRVFSPARQAERFDPDGAYIKRWVPQLAQADRRRLLHGVERADIHTGYPPPMVDIAASRQAALARWDAIKTMPREAS